MIRADFFANADGALLGFSVLGHSGLAQEGEDILCAAVSSTAYMTANTVLEILHITPISLRAEDGEMLFRVSDTDARTCRSLFEGFKLHLLGLEEQYPETLSGTLRRSLTIKRKEGNKMLKINIQLFAHKKVWAPRRTAVIPNPKDSVSSVQMVSTSSQATFLLSSAARISIRART